MKKLMALILSLLMVTSLFALCVMAEDETTAAAADEATTEAAGEETTEEAPSFSKNVLVFDENAKKMKVLSGPNGIRNAFYNSDWEGARLELLDVGDPYVTINWSSYAKKAGVEKINAEDYPFVVIKLKVEGYVGDFELFYVTGDAPGVDQAYASTTDYPHENSGEVECIIYDLTDDCEGEYKTFRFDPMEADEDSVVYLIEMAMFATEDEALAYAGYLDDGEDEETTVEETEETTEEETEETTTKAPATTEKQTEAEKEEGCGSIISVGAVVAMIALGALCIKKKD